jgi:putative polyketide hydroxylase
VGARVPHFPLAGDGDRVSTLDVAGPGFALLADHGHDAWRRAAAEAAESLGAAVAVQPIDRDCLPEPAEPAAVTAGAGWTGAALIRPDEVIAWKPDVPAAEAAGQLATVLAGLLSRGGT